jgi:hypothetical protein
MKRVLLFTILAVGFMMLPKSAHAMVIHGTVTDLHLSTNSITVSYTDPGTQATELLSVAVIPEAELNGVASLSELKVGDLVSLEASQNEVTGLWEAKTLSVSGMAVPIAGG